MAERSYTSVKRGLLSSLTALALLSATSSGCLATSMIEKSAMGEPKEGVRFGLSTGANAYEIARWWDARKETLSMPRCSLPAGCDTARFFLNDSVHELQIALPATAEWVTRERPPLPYDSYPPCALLVSYGSFSEPPALEGVVVCLIE